MRHEKRFYDALRDIFIGAKVEGKSGYINLMAVKSRFYEKEVFPVLQRKINEETSRFPKFKEELFDKLYTFFQRYFSESGSVYFTDTRLHHRIYEKVYTDDKDIMMFWKTHMLYYVKTEKLFKNLEVEVDNIKFLFDVSSLEHSKASEKKKIVYDFSKKRTDGTVVFDVRYSERGRKTKIIDLLKILKKEGVKIDDDQLTRAFGIFEKQTAVDYFINKSAEGFLREQFDMWFYQYLFTGGGEWTPIRIQQLQILRNIANQIIDFIGQFEDELVKIWNKPKFVLNSNYVVTLDKVAEKDNNVTKRILEHPGMDNQAKEWAEFGIVGKRFEKRKLIKDGKLNGRFRYLPIDTRYFKNLESDILALFDKHDESLDGWLIKSENYQALNTILPKFREKVQTIYIDPPFNKEQEADYLYKVKYKDSTWVTLLENRLRVGKNMLAPSGSIFIRCDYNGNMLVRLLMDEVWPAQSFKNEICIRKSGIQKEAKNKFLVATESLFYYTKENTTKPKETFEHRETGWLEFVHYPGERGESKTRSVFGIDLMPPRGRHWGISQSLIDEWLEHKWIRFRCKQCGYKHYAEHWNGCPKCESDDFIAEIKNPPKKVDSNWTNLQSYSQDPDFPTRNAEELLRRVIECSSRKGDLVMDFFLGSGTAVAVAHKLRRKWIGIEVGEHFYPYTGKDGKQKGVLTRMKEVLAGRGNLEPYGISHEIGWQGGGFFKYYELEQYEDALRKVKYDDSDLFQGLDVLSLDQYVFMKDLKMLDAVEIAYEENRVDVDFSKLYDNIDIPETLSNLTGKWIDSIMSHQVEFEDGEKVDTEKLDYNTIKPLIWWQ